MKLQLIVIFVACMFMKCGSFKSTRAFAIPLPQKSRHRISRSSFVHIATAQSIDLANVQEKMKGEIYHHKIFMPRDLMKKYLITRQALVGSVLYYFHSVKLSQYTLPSFNIASICADTAVSFSITTVVVAIHYYKAYREKESRRDSEMLKLPWRLNNEERFKGLGVAICIALVHLYVGSFLSDRIGQVLFDAHCIGLRLSQAMFSSLQISISHFITVWLQFQLLKLAFPLIASNIHSSDQDADELKVKKSEEDNVALIGEQKIIKQKSKWLSMNFVGSLGKKDAYYWLKWVGIGYLVTFSLQVVSDALNQLIVSTTSIEENEQWINEIVQAGNKHLISGVVGAIAPCIVAPIWEEVFYRGFLLPCLHMLGIPIQWCVPLSGLLFACHHGAVASLIPLTVLGSLWALIYIQSGNLAVTMLIHSLWNFRVFLDSYVR